MVNFVRDGKEREGAVSVKDASFEGGRKVRWSRCYEAPPQGVRFPSLCSHANFFMRACCSLVLRAGDVRPRLLSQSDDTGMKSTIDHVTSHKVGQNKCSNGEDKPDERNSEGEGEAFSTVRALGQLL